MFLLRIYGHSFDLLPVRTKKFLINPTKCSSWCYPVYNLKHWPFNGIFYFKNHICLRCVYVNMHLSFTNKVYLFIVIFLAFLFGLFGEFFLNFCSYFDDFIDIYKTIQTRRKKYSGFNKTDLM